MHKKDICIYVCTKFDIIQDHTTKWISKASQIRGVLIKPGLAVNCIVWRGAYMCTLYLRNKANTNKSVDWVWRTTHRTMFINRWIL